MFFTSIVNFVLFGGLVIKSFYLGGGGVIGVGWGWGGVYMYFNWVDGINVKWAMVYWQICQKVSHYVSCYSKNRF